MAFDTFKRIVDETEENFELQLEGGEPLLHKNLFLFLEYAVSTNRCTKIILLTNGILLEEHINRLIDFSSWNQILLEIKVSINYFLIEKNENISEKMKRVLIKMLNDDHRKRPSVYELMNDEWLKEGREERKGG